MTTNQVPPSLIEDIDLSGLSDFDRKIWDSILEWQRKEEKEITLPRALEGAKGKADAVVNTAKGKVAKSIPGVEGIASTVRESVQGVLEFLNSTNAATVKDSSVLKKYRKRGFDLKEIEDIGNLRLKDILKN